MRRARRQPPADPDTRLQQRVNSLEGRPPAWRAGQTTNAGPTRRITGTINTTSTTILSGGGFTIVKNGVGDITITWSQAFPTGTAPSVQATAVVNGFNVAAELSSTPTATSATIHCLKLDGTQGALDTIFCFTAEGLQQ